MHSQTDDYWYNWAGLRVKKIEDAEGTPKTTYTLFDGINPLMQEIYKGATRIQTTFNIIINGQILAQYKRVYPSTDSVAYFYLDYLSSRRVVLDSSGTAVDRYRYSAWGEATQDLGSDDYRSFTGKQYDATGMICFNARYYDPVTGRFLTEDPAMNGINWYGYCENNPLVYVDPRGFERYEIEMVRNLRNEEITKRYDTTRHLEKHQKYHVVTKDEARVASLKHSKEPRYFGQREFDFLNDTTAGDKKFNFILETDDGRRINQLCNATSMINEMSEEYTRRTGQQMTLIMAADMLRAGLMQGSLNPFGAPSDPVNGQGGFFNDAWSTIPLGGTWRRDDTKSNHQIYFTKGWFGNLEGSHFVNSGPSGNFSESRMMFDTWTGKEKTPPSTYILKEIRNYEYVP